MVGMPARTSKAFVVVFGGAASILVVVVVVGFVMGTAANPPPAMGTNWTKTCCGTAAEAAVVVAVGFSDRPPVTAGNNGAAFAGCVADPVTDDVSVEMLLFPSDELLG